MGNTPAKVVLVGSPNVGKSAIFNYLTGSYVAVSNYPGTTVDIATGYFQYGGRRFEVIDTPGIYSLIPLTDEEKVTRLLLSSQMPDIVVHVIDAKNIQRMLAITLQLMDAGLPVILNLNVMDEARDIGMVIDHQLLEKMLGIPVVTTSAVEKTGLETLKKAISNYQQTTLTVFNLHEEVEQAVAAISSRLTRAYGFSKRMTALLLLQGDFMMNEIAQSEPAWREIADTINRLAEQKQCSLETMIAGMRQDIIGKIVGRVVKYANCKHRITNRLAGWLGKITRQPVTGIPILCLVLYFGLYQFVGKFGAGILVDYLNNSVFIPLINPIVKQFVSRLVPWGWAQEYLVGDYGIFTMGFRYALAIILPIVGTFFLTFAILEDSGYLPRLAMLVDSIFRFFGLNGRAIIPLTLGLGCGTMAVMVTRTLESSRERLLATFLLALAVPCSAQLGVVLALLSHNPAALTIWSIFMLIVFASIGWLSAQIVPGSRSAFYMELPPLRLPLMSNVIKKAHTRVVWYFMEILPVFIITSMVLCAAHSSGILDTLIHWGEPVMLFIGLPPATAQAFLLGFFRRDYGAAGLYDLAVDAKLTDAQLVVAAIAITLFVPCIAQLAVMVKERGLLVATVMVMLIISIAFVSAALVYRALTLLSIPL